MSNYDGDNAIIPFDLDEWVTVNLLTLKNVLTFIMNKVNKTSKYTSDLVEASNEMKKRVGDIEKVITEVKTEADLLKTDTKNFIEEQTKINK